jgi:hypothetical protein
MKHAFIPSQANSERCSICKWPEPAHKPDAICEACPNQASLEIFNNMALCSDCITKEIDAYNKLDADGRVAFTRENAKRTMEIAKSIDHSIQIQTDIFNAKTVAINELKIAIDSDETITEKNFALAKTLDERYKHLSEVLFSKRQEVSEAENEQRAIQTYYNELAKKLRAEEREKIKLQDVKYQPIQPKIGKPKSVTPKAYDKVGIKNAAAQSGLPEQAIQMICLTKNISPVEAVRVLINAGLKAKE